MSLNASLLRLKLLDGLRSGDPGKVTDIINQLNATKATTQTTNIINIKHTVLHYAVQVAPLPVLQHLVEHAKELDLDINSVDQEGNTPLHLAAASSRQDVVRFLLSLPDINDTTANLERKQPVEVCRDLEVAQLMQFERAKFVEKAALQLRECFTNRDTAGLERLLVTHPRASELLDINGADPDTGYTVLHEFILKNDAEMCSWILAHGGDPFKRDKRGRLPADLVGKSETLRKMLKAASRDQTIMDPVVASQRPTRAAGAPTYKGYLKKWTNFASGYKLRYFVLDDKGILSYYTNQDDTNNACRGSLNLGFAQLHLDSSEKLKFEIIGKNGIRWHLKANHPIETNRWVWTLQNAITVAKDGLKGRTDDTATGAAVAQEEPKRHLLSLRARKHKRDGSQGTIGSMGDEELTPSRASSLKRKNATPKPMTSAGAAGATTTTTDLDSDAENFDYDLEDNDSESESLDKASDNSAVDDQISTVRGSLEVEITSLLDLFKNASDSPDSVDAEVCHVGLNTLKEMHDLFAKYNSLIVKRDSRTTRKLERQLEVNRLWEHSIRQLEAEIASREKKLVEYEGKRKQLRKYLKSGASTPTSGAAVEESGSMLGILNDSEDEFFDAEDDGEEEIGEIGDVTKGEDTKGDDTKPEESTKAEDATRSDSKTGAVAGAVAGAAGAAGVAGAAGAAAGITKLDTTKLEESTKAEGTTKAEETTNAEETTKPQTTIESKNSLQQSKATTIESQRSFLGYENPPRSKLPMDEDDRPKVGLWGILKSMIGKDMTRMTLPVSFNECTSLLQRLAEDVEYSDLLDKAATFDDSCLRTAYVAAFATSEYASTINRIAKPFNPLLGETFEYCRPDKNYRLVSEQVSHHPPVSACNVESTKWDYYGENAVDSQFKGRSFDFKHLGRMFCAVRPDNGVVDRNGNKVDQELYSWKKVNTSVVGIMLGNPTVDNYGPMEVTNHTTGDRIIVDMKQRGWRASSAYQLNGTVCDSKGTGRWAIGGHWNSRIYGRKLQRDSNAATRTWDDTESTTSVQTDPFSGGRFLIWQAAPRPKVPFNLTQFAITLNGIDNNLKEYLAPTDTRLRPDQRAMEDGKYDLAGDEKHRVEEKQRAARRAREQNKEVYKPKWFVKRKHPDTGHAFWEYNGEYWPLRAEKKLEGSGDIF